MSVPNGDAVAVPVPAFVSVFVAMSVPVVFQPLLMPVLHS
jgi:hypothetical protein